MLKHILVYGTLKSGQCNHSLITDAGAQKVATLRVPGYDLFKLGWYPGIRPNPQNKVGVECELYEFDGSRENLNKLDYYEGFIETEPEMSLFLREEVETSGPTGFTNAYIYSYARDPGGRAVKIEDGVW